MQIQALDQHHANAVNNYLHIHHRAAPMPMPVPTLMATPMPMPVYAQAMPISMSGPCDALNDVPTFSSCRFSSWCVSAAAGGAAADASGGASAGGSYEPDFTTMSAEYAPGDPVLLAALSGSSSTSGFSSSDVRLVDSSATSVGRSEPPPSESFAAGPIAPEHAVLTAEASPGAATYAARNNPFLHLGNRHLQSGTSFQDVSAAVRRVIADTTYDQQPLEWVPTSSKKVSGKVSTLDPVSFFRSAGQQQNGVPDCGASHVIRAPLRTHSSIVSMSGPPSCLESGSSLNGNSLGGSGNSSSSIGAFHLVGGSSSSSSSSSARGAPPPPAAPAAAAASTVADVMPSATETPEAAMLSNPFTWKELENSCRKLDEANVRISGIDLTHAPDYDDGDDHDLDNDVAGHQGKSSVCVEKPGIWKQMSSVSLSSNEESSWKPHNRVPSMDAGSLQWLSASPEPNHGALQQNGGSSSSSSSFAAAAAEARRRGPLSGPVMPQCAPMAAISPGSSSAEPSPSSSSSSASTRLRLAWLSHRGEAHKRLFRRLLGAVGRSAHSS